MSLPGFDKAAASAVAVGLGLMGYLIFTTIEYWHDYRQTALKYAEWVQAFPDEIDVLKAIESLRSSVASVERTIESIIQRTKSDDEEVDSEIRKNLDDFEKLGSKYVYNGNLEAIDRNNEKESMEFYDRFCELCESSRQYISSIEKRKVLNKDHLDQQSILIFECHRKISDLVEKSYVPSAAQLKTLSTSLHLSDRRMFRAHDAWVPFALSIAAFSALAIDIGSKIYDLGWDAFNSTELYPNQADARPLPAPLPK